MTDICHRRPQRPGSGDYPPNRHGSDEAGKKKAAANAATLHIVWNLLAREKMPV